MTTVTNLKCYTILFLFEIVLTFDKLFLSYYFEFTKKYLYGLIPPRFYTQLESKTLKRFFSVFSSTLTKKLFESTIAILLQICRNTKKLFFLALKRFQKNCSNSTNIFIRLFALSSNGKSMSKSTNQI